MKRPAILAALGMALTARLTATALDGGAGTSTTLTVRLARAIKRLAGRKHQVRVLAVASTGPAGNIVPSSRRLTLALR